MKAVDLIRLNMEIESVINLDGDLEPLPEKESAIFSISRHRDGYVTYFRQDVPSAIRERLRALDVDRLLDDHEMVKRILSEHTPCKNVFAGRSCYLTHTPSPDEFPDAVLHEGCYVIMVDGKPVSWAWTQDGNEQAAELAVETLPEFRRRGYGRQVVAAWAANVIGSGKVAFYSYIIGNVASEALARSLEVVQYAIMTTYS